MWSGFFLFWLLSGSLFIFWCWFFDVVFVKSLLEFRSVNDYLPQVSLLLTALFSWCYFNLYFALIDFPLTSITWSVLGHESSKSALPIFGLINLYTFPFLYIFILVTTIALIFCLSYNRQEAISFYGYIVVIFFAGFLFFSSTSVITFFLAYELFLVPSFLILYKFAKTRRAIEASYLMFFWTQFGALFLILSFLYTSLTTGSTSWNEVRNFNFTPLEASFLTVCWVVGFGVKLPLWPFYGWLPKAHVEASTNFSIFLSGVLVKFAFFGLLRCLETLHVDPACPALIPFLTVGLVDASFKLFLQTDLKKIVAYATVIEMHWLTICIFSGSSPIMLAGLAMLVNHALLSANAFLLVDAINRRFKTRLITELSGLNLLCPKLFILSFINCLLFLGFPGSLTFVSEILFFSFLIDLFPAITLLLVVFLYLLAPTFFFRSWFNAMFGMSQFFSSKPPVDLSVREFLAIASLEALIYYLGISWQIFFI